MPRTTTKTRNAGDTIRVNLSGAVADMVAANASAKGISYASYVQLVLSGDLPFPVLSDSTPTDNGSDLPEQNQIAPLETTTPRDELSRTKTVHFAPRKPAAVQSAPVPSLADLPAI